MKRLSLYFLLLMIAGSCKKTTTPDVVPVPVPQKKILLKDITRPGLPSPYYLFTYRPDSTVATVSFASGLSMYEVVYQQTRIAEMRNNISVNHDTLRYAYDAVGKLIRVDIINDANLLYKQVLLTYVDGKISSVAWRRLEGPDFIEFRSLFISYFSDGNAKQIIDHRQFDGGQPPVTLITEFSDYDDRIKVDDYTLLHDGMNDHLFILPTGLIQKNNPRKETRSGSGTHYNVTYQLNYNSDRTPVRGIGSVMITSGPQAGQTFQTRTEYSYY